MQAIQRLTGVYLEDNKLYLLEARLNDIMKDYNLSTYDQVASKIDRKDDSIFLDKIIENITTHETRFFRDESVYDALIMQIIPEWFDKMGVTPLNLRGNRLNIWSAACSTGQEPYSISMIIHEKFPALAGSFSILGTDISKHTIEKAQRGEYTKFEAERGLNEYYLRKYFVNQNDKYTISKKISDPVTFKVHNLITDSYSNSFDLILCRNVVIYFTEMDRKSVYNRLKNSLKSDGVLVLGSSESLMGYTSNYILREFGLARYYEFASKVTFF